MGYFTSITDDRLEVTMPERVVPCPITFGQDAPVFLPVEAGQGISLVAARQTTDGDHWAVCIGVADDRGYLIKRHDRSVTVLGTGKVHGPYAVWVTSAGDVSWVPAKAPYTLEHLDGRVGVSRDTSHPLSPDALSRENLGPVIITRVVRDGDWVSGEDVTAPNGVTRLYARKHGETCRHVWTGYSSLPAQMVAHADGTCTIPVQIPHGIADALFIHSLDFTPYVAPMTLVRVPTFAPTLHPVLVCTSGEPNPIARLVEVSENAAQVDPSIVAVFHTLGRDDLPAALKLCRQHGVPLAAYHDEPGYPYIETAFAGVDLDGIEVIPLIFGYPVKRDGLLESIPLSMVRIREAVRRLRPRRVGVVMAYYRQIHGDLLTYNWPRQHVLDQQGALWQLVREEQIDLVWCWPYTRADGRDGMVSLPELRESHRRLYAAADASPRLDLRASKPQPEPDEPDEPEPPMPPLPSLPRHRLVPEERLLPGEGLVSQNGRFDLVHQHDGNVVLYRRDGTPLWASQTSGQITVDLVLHPDGNLVLYGPEGRAVWASGSAGTNPDLSLQDDGNAVLYSDGVPIWATNTAEEQPQEPDVVMPPPTSVALTRLHVDGRGLVREDGSPFVWRGVSAFRLVYDVARGDEAHAREFLAWAQVTGFNLVRVFSTVVHMFDLSPEDGRDALPRALELCAEYGLYAEVVAVADSASRDYDFQHHAMEVARICAAHQPVAIYEFANEPLHGTQHEDLHHPDNVQRYAEESVSGLSMLWTAGPAESDEANGNPLGAYVVRHLDRGREGWQNIRRVWDIAYVQEETDKPTISDEPMGFDERDGRETGRQRFNNPDYALAFGVLHRITATGMTFHCQAGLQSDVPGPVQRECAEAFIRGTRFMPDDVVLVRKNANWEDSPVGGADFEKVVRVPSGVSGTEGLTIAIGISGDPKIVWKNGWSPRETLVDRPEVKVWRIGR